MSIFSIQPNTPKIIVILRGLEPKNAEEIGKILFDAGFRILEVTLNSPEPYQSIEILRKTLPDSVLIGAGTVLQTEEVKKVKNAGGNLIISPNLDLDVVRTTLEEGMISLPGVFTPTEAFLALKQGASMLKFFPSEVLGITGLNAIAAVLPTRDQMIVVGGVSINNLATYLSNGFSWFGIGSNIYKKGDSPHETEEKASKFMKTYLENNCPTTEVF